MIVYRRISDVPADRGPSVVAIGKFDGVHTGHRALLQRAHEYAAELGAEVVAVTFDRNPLRILRPDLCPDDVASVEQKLELLEAAGVAETLLLTFDEERSKQSAEDFVREVLVGALSAQLVLLGEDFRFGQGGQGNPALLSTLGETLGFEVVVLREVQAQDHRRISSSLVRESLAYGEVARAAELLGRPHAVRGEVVHGAKRGRELGFPTANLETTPEGLLPEDGIYAGWLVDEVDGARYPAAISVGTNPTFDDVLARQAEAYVLDRTDLDLYGHTVELLFVERIRGMVAFEGVEKLIAQMTDDVVRARDILGVA